MKNTGPFKSFLRLVGKVPGATDSCPTLPADEPMELETQPGVEPEPSAVGR